VLLREGRVEQEGTPDDLYSRPKTPFVARFIGSPPMNLVEGEVRGGRFRGPIEWPVDAPDGPAILGVRPEALVPGEGPWDGTVEVVENLGAEAYVHVRVGGLLLTLRSARDAAPAAGTRLKLAPQHVHVFPKGARRAG